jgi:hypothetical protein
MVTHVKKDGTPVNDVAAAKMVSACILVVNISLCLSG